MEPFSERHPAYSQRCSYLEPIVVEWNDAAHVGGWQDLNIPEDFPTPMPVVTRGYFLEVKDGFLLMTSDIANHSNHGLLGWGIQAIPTSIVTSISTRKESPSEKLVRLKRKLWL